MTPVIRPFHPPEGSTCSRCVSGSPTPRRWFRRARPPSVPPLLSRPGALLDACVPSTPRPGHRPGHGVQLPAHRRRSPPVPRAPASSSPRSTAAAATPAPTSTPTSSSSTTPPTADISLDGKSLQYRSPRAAPAPPTGRTLSGNVPAGEHFLIQTERRRRHRRRRSPTPDATVTSISMAAANGTICLANGTGNQTLTPGVGPEQRERDRPGRLRHQQHVRDRRRPRRSRPRRRPSAPTRPPTATTTAPTSRSARRPRRPASATRSRRRTRSRPRSRRSRATASASPFDGDTGHHRGRRHRVVPDRWLQRHLHPDRGHRRRHRRHAGASDAIFVYGGSSAEPRTRPSATSSR